MKYLKPHFKLPQEHSKNSYQNYVFVFNMVRTFRPVKAGVIVASNQSNSFLAGCLFY